MAKLRRTTNRGIRLLSLDGGGIRGLSTLLIIQSLMKEIQRQKGLPSPPKPCDYFDLIGGTSSGGLIALMLGHLQMSIDEAIREFNRISDSVFNHGFLDWIRWPFVPFGMGRHSGSRLAQGFRELIKEKTENEETLLCPLQATTHPSGIVPDSNASVSDKGDCLCFVTVTVKIWEAARATSAAPSYFESITLGNGVTYGDGGILANNPSNVLLAEKERIWGNSHDIQCMVSIGTGIPNVKKIPGNIVGAMKAIIDAQLNAEAKHRIFEAAHTNLSKYDRYFRFNVQMGLSDIRLDEWREKGSLDLATGTYLEQIDVSLKRTICARRLAYLPVGADAHEDKINLAPSPVRHFVERGFLMQRIEEQWLKEQTKILGNATIVVLFGAGGIGKSQIALRFCERHREHFDRILRLDCSSANNFNDTAADVLRRLGVQCNEEAGKALKEYIEKTQMRWLMIFDNLDSGSTEMPIGNFIPKQHYTTVLVTTRREDWRACGTLVNITAMNPTEALELLFAQAFANYDLTAAEKDDERLKERGMGIVEDLGYLPLAIDICGSYIAHIKDRTFEHYLEQRQQSRFRTFKNALSMAPLYARSVDYPDSVLTTWKMSINAVVQTNGPAALLLLTMAFLNQNNLYKELFWRAISPKHRFMPDGTIVKFGPLDIGIPRWLVELMTDENGSSWDDFAFEDAVSLLCSLSLLQKESDLPYSFPPVHQGPFGIWRRSKPVVVQGKFSVHPLIRDWLLLDAYEKDVILPLKVAINAMRVAANAVPDDVLCALEKMFRRPVTESHPPVMTEDGGVWVDDCAMWNILSDESVEGTHAAVLRTAFDQIRLHAFAVTSFLSEQQLANSDSPLRVHASNLRLEADASGSLVGSFKDENGAIVSTGPVDVNRVGAGIVSEEISNSATVLLNEYLLQRKTMDGFFYSYMIFEVLEQLRQPPPWPVTTCVHLPLLLQQLERFCICVDWTIHDIHIPGEFNYLILLGRAFFAQFLTKEVCKFCGCCGIAEESKVIVFKGLVRRLQMLQGATQEYTSTHGNAVAGSVASWVLTVNILQLTQYHGHLGPMSADEAVGMEKSTFTKLLNVMTATGLSLSCSPEQLQRQHEDELKILSEPQSGANCKCDFMLGMVDGSSAVWKLGQTPPPDVPSIGVVSIDPSDCKTALMTGMSLSSDNELRRILREKVKIDPNDLKEIFEEKGIQDPSEGEQNDAENEIDPYIDDSAAVTVLPRLLEVARVSDIDVEEESTNGPVVRKQESTSSGQSGSDAAAVDDEGRRFRYELV